MATSAKRPKTRKQNSWVLPDTAKSLAASKPGAAGRPDTILPNVSSYVLLPVCFALLVVCGFGAYRFVYDEHFWALPCGNGWCGSTQTQALPWAAIIGLLDIYILSLRISKSKVMARQITVVAVALVLALPLFVLFGILSYNG